MDYPSRDVCQALRKLSPNLRLAWHGARDRFAIVQLYHISDCGDIDDPHTFREYWNVTTVTGPTGTEHREKIDRGHIFNSWGGTTPDWNPLQRVPIFVTELEGVEAADGTALNRYDVMGCSDKFRATIRHWLRPPDEVREESIDERNRQYARDADALTRDMTDHWWWQGNQTGSASVNIAKKHADKVGHRALHEPHRMVKVKDSERKRKG